MELVWWFPPGENMMKSTMTAAALSFAMLANSAMAMNKAEFVSKASQPEVGWFFEILRKILETFTG